MPHLVAPVWDRQPDESDRDYAAFAAWLRGGRDWPAAIAIAGLPFDELRAVSLRWVWDVRAHEYEVASRAAHAQAVAPLKEKLVELTAGRLDYMTSLVELVKTEIKKYQAASAQSTAHALTARELVRFLAVAEDSLELLRRQAEGLPPEDTGTTINWDRLSPAELEQHRKLRDKARGGVG
jgi:hypothetical protein